MWIWMSGRRDDTSCLLVLFVLIKMVVLRVAFEYLNLIASIKVELRASSFPCDYVRVKNMKRFTYETFSTCVVWRWFH